MNNHQQPDNMKSIYVWGFPINLALELSIQFVSLIIPVYIIQHSIYPNQILLIVVAIVIAIYLYPLTLLFLSALITRLLPKPKLGYLNQPQDLLKFQTLIALNTFVRRTPARWLLIFPFPGYLFYKLSGTKIAPTALITSPDTLQDVYLVSIGENSVLGWGCLVLGHYSGDGITTIIGEVAIGNNVLIGEQATIWANVKIGDRAIIQNKSVVMPGTIVPPNEIWGGVPAKKIRERQEQLIIDSIDFVQIKRETEQLIIEQLNQKFELNVPLVDLGLDLEQINRLIRQLEQKYQVMINRTKIKLDKFSFLVLVDLLKQELEKK